MIFSARNFEVSTNIKFPNMRPLFEVLRLQHLQVFKNKTTRQFHDFPSWELYNSKNNQMSNAMFFEHAFACSLFLCVYIYIYIYLFIWIFNTYTFPKNVFVFRR